MENKFEVKDSGERREFQSGAQRDVENGKPRFDLIPVTVLKKLLSYDLSKIIDYDLTTQSMDHLKSRMWNAGIMWGDTTDETLLLQLILICAEIIQRQEGDRYISPPISIIYDFSVMTPRTYHRIAMLYSRGADKYDPWNWSKGMPLSVFHASLMRHIFSFIEDKTDEDHLSAIFFNAACIIHFKVLNIDEIDDITPRLRKWYKDENNES